ncbi:hypothetical protein KEM52_005795, partial [Ascosphaera acerosa]
RGPGRLPGPHPPRRHLPQQHEHRRRDPLPPRHLPQPPAQARQRPAVDQRPLDPRLRRPLPGLQGRQRRQREGHLQADQGGRGGDRVRGHGRQAGLADVQRV